MKVPALLVCLLAGFAPGRAQLPAGPVTMGHWHLNVRDLDANLRFWKTLGGTPAKLAKIDYVRFPDVLVFLREAEPSGGTDGSVINHVGFRVKNLDQSLARWKEAGLTILPGSNPKQAFVISPDQVRIEMTEDASMTVPIAHHHVHFYTPSATETQAWYVKMFGARPGKRGKFDAADLPGVNLTFSVAEKPLAPTKGRALDHFGFEVRGLEAFCRRLESEGVKFDAPYRKLPQLGIAVAFLTDPWGSYVELTEGLDRL
jgi:catechol 2,3-dioxygenase-like lactoylglutathione lyase family enzyme